ncbi:hypothetical protein ACHAXA_008896 [Cyclostephanos tholiformis]|uniref:Uncharacterized protein n=1 Tax=Cyclostephanos tholiformis TaxID=382380 RepID=A0ABD3R728_9STRA
MTDAYVQFMRNALCTIKNFGLFGTTFLYDPKVTSNYYAFPSPLDETTPLEFLIAMTQLYAFVSVSLAGYRMIAHSGLGKLRLLGRLVELKKKKDIEGKKRKKNTEVEKKKKNKEEKENSGNVESEAVVVAAASRLVLESIIDEGDASSRSTFVGVNVLIVGLAFFWLFANSFHVTSTDWIGGTAGLIHSLTVMELGLVVFLYYMAKDAGNHVSRSRRMVDFATKIAKSRRLSIADAKVITVEEYGWLLLGGWSPFWARGISNPIAESKILTKEEEAVASNLSSFMERIEDDVIDGILARSRISSFEGYREYVYLILNFFAFYGYFVSILVYYYPDESSRPAYVRGMLFGMKGTDADWLGNAVGDFMWTVEPVIILSSPIIIDSLSPKKTKKEKIS